MCSDWQGRAKGESRVWTYHEGVVDRDESSSSSLFEDGLLCSSALGACKKGIHGGGIQLFDCFLSF